MKTLTKENTSKEEYIELVKLEMIKLLVDGEACDNPDCLNGELCHRCDRIAGVRKKLIMSPEEMLEKNVTLAYDEPWPAMGPPGTDITYANVQIRIKAKDAVNIRRHLSKENPKYAYVPDTVFLDDFIAVNWVYIIK